MPSTIADFRRHALALPGAVESSHMGHPDFRLNDQIFATLSAQAKGCGVLKLTLDQQQSFISEIPKVFEPVHGGWGRMGMTFIHLAAADDAILKGRPHDRPSQSRTQATKHHTIEEEHVKESSNKETTH